MVNKLVEDWNAVRSSRDAAFIASLLREVLARRLFGRRWCRALASDLGEDRYRFPWRCTWEGRRHDREPGNAL